MKSAMLEQIQEDKHNIFNVYGSIPWREKCIVFDIDGVLIDNSERVKRTLEEIGARDVSELDEEKKKKFWDIFLSDKYIDLDKPNPQAIELAKKRKSEGYRIVILTGRPMKMMKKTIEQLNKYGVPYDAIIFRSDGYYAKDYEYKKKVLEEMRLTVIELHDDSEPVCSHCAPYAKNIYLWRNQKPELFKKENNNVNNS
uniref:HAD family hydrolase n=1 Tax=Ignisphaera aggregans TaxID=334771 RepID=A0A7C4H4Q3_9CREN